jgi:hypothetical protein
MFLVIAAYLKHFRLVVSIDLCAMFVKIDHECKEVFKFTVLPGECFMLTGLLAGWIITQHLDQCTHAVDVLSITTAHPHPTHHPHKCSLLDLKYVTSMNLTGMCHREV